jgi:hypothetical protein
VIPVAPATPVAAPVAPAAQAVQPLYTGGAKVVKVILDKSKNKTRKIILSAPKRVIKLASGSSEDISKKHPAKTQKVARRIRVSVDGLKRRVHRAKTIKKESQMMTIDKIKKELEKAGLIKTDSKAPELILRQMYTDYQMLKQRAL